MWLKCLDLSSNDMEGELTGPSSNVSGCTQFALETLFLSDNKFGVEIPKSLEKLTALTELGLDKNKLSGNIPEALGNITRLLFLDLSENQLRGCLGHLFRGQKNFWKKFQKARFPDFSKKSVFLF